MWVSTVDSISKPLTSYWDQFVSYLPQLVGALVILLVGLIVASVIAGVVKKLLSLAEENKDVQKFLARWDIRLRLSGFVGKFAWWVIFLVFLSAAVDVLDIAVLSATISTFVGYLPQLFAAAVVASIALLGARIVRSLVVSALEGVNFDQSRVVGMVVYVALLVFGMTLAAAQLGVDTGLLTANITVIVGGIVLALALAFGLGGRDVAARIVEKAYTNAETKPAAKKLK